jgi:major membrane immunogen (membrane-anchored lipoprotein)
VNYANVFAKFILSQGLLVALVILLTGCGTTDNSRQHQPVPIRATGVGSSFEDAKENAFKQAIENRIGVLVLSDREVQSYKLLKDEILTYSAGYVDDYAVISQDKAGKKWFVTVDVWVSASKLTSRIISSKESDGKMNGKKASDSFTSYVKQKQQADRLTSKVLSGFPENAVVAKFDRTELKFDSNRNAQVLVYFETNWNRGYLDSLMELLSLIEDGKDSRYAVGQVRVHYKEQGDWFPTVAKYQFSDAKLMSDFSNKFGNRRIAVRLKLKDGGLVTYENCWNLPDAYTALGHGEIVSIFGHRGYQSVITLTIPYGTSAQRMLENSNRAQLSVESSERCENRNNRY